MSIQSSINSMIGSVATSVAAYKGYQQLKAKNAQQSQKAAAATQTSVGSSPQAQAAQVARQSADNEIKAKKEQKRNFMDYLGRQQTSLGGTVSQLPIAMQKQIASQYTKSQRKSLMDKMDREEKDGKH